MATTVTLTGTGVPFPQAGRAGAGTLVRCGNHALQFDAGRATTLRLAEAGILPHQLTAVFITHVHSDHIVDLPDIAMTRWTRSSVGGAGPLVVIAAEGNVERFVASMLAPYADDIAVRMHHVQPSPPEIDLRTFTAPPRPEVVWRSEDEQITVTAVGVHHEPVTEAVAYRIDTPDGALVISGDTRVCTEVEELCHGADLLVHEACRTTALAEVVKGTPLETIFEYHADTVALGAMAERAGVPRTVLTHLIPAPDTPEAEADFAKDLKAGGYRGHITVGRDLQTFTLTGKDHL